MNHAIAVAVAAAIALQGACGASAERVQTAARPQLGVGDSGVSQKQMATGPMNGPSAVPANLPPFAPMPAPGVRGSALAKASHDRAFETCLKRIKPVRNAAEAAHQLAQSCAVVSKSKRVGMPMVPTNSDAERGSESSFRAESGKCYRVYSAHTAEIMETAIVLRDAAGNMIVDSPADAVPESGAFCFSEATTVSVTLSIGRGKGTFAAEVWGNEGPAAK